MGMDIHGKSGNYFRANIWSWPVICLVMKDAGYVVPEDWYCNSGEGLTNQIDCDELADLLDARLEHWTGQEIVVESSSIQVNDAGYFVRPGTPGSRSPYRTDREHLNEWIAFLRNCDGFEIW